MKVIILGGFLGSGKTTLLLRLAPFLAQGSGKDPAVVVLENEISVTDVDTRLLKSRNLTVRNLTAGCICCTSTGQLTESVAAIRREYDPDYLIVEATGMAYPDAIADTLAGEEPRVITLADASRWEKLNQAMPAFVQGQLVRADVVFLNKVDLVSEETLARVLELLKTQTAAPVYPVSLAGAMDEALLEDLR